MNRETHVLLHKNPCRVRDFVADLDPNVQYYRAQALERAIRARSFGARPAAARLLLISNLLEECLNRIIDVEAACNAGRGKRKLRNRAAATGSPQAVICPKIRLKLEGRDALWLASGVLNPQPERTQQITYNKAAEK